MSHTTTRRAVGALVLLLGLFGPALAATSSSAPSNAPGNSTSTATTSAIAEPVLPSPEARRAEQLRAEQIGFRIAETRRMAELSTKGDAEGALAEASAASASSPSTAPLSGTSAPLASRLPRGGIAKPSADAGPSSLAFWMKGPVPPWTLLCGLLLGLSFLTASWLLHLRAARSKKLVLDLLPTSSASPVAPAPSRNDARKLEPAASQPARPEPALRERDLPLRGREMLNARAEEQAAPSRQWEREALAEVPRQFARFTTIDEEPGYREPRKEAPARRAEPREERAIEAARRVARREPAVANAPSTEEVMAAFDRSESIELRAPRTARPEPQELAQQEPAPQVRLLRSVTSYGVPIPPRAERSTPSPKNGESRPSKKRAAGDAAKLSRRVSLLEGSMLQLLSSVDRLAGRVEGLADRIPAARAEDAGAATPPSARETAPDLGPWSDPSVALPPAGRSIHPEPFFARLAADRARSKSEDSVRLDSAATESPRAARSASPARTAKPVDIAQARATQPAPAKKTAAPKPDVAKQARALDPARVRELVLKLSRHGWDADRISRESRIPARDVNLILKSAQRESGTADFAEQRR